MNHEINIPPTTSDGIVEISEVTSVGVFKKDGKHFVKFDVRDTKGLKHSLNFDVDSGPQLSPGSKIKVRFTTTVDQDFAEISKGAVHVPSSRQSKDYPQAIPSKPVKSGEKDGGKGPDDEEPFISFQTG